MSTTGFFLSSALDRAAAGESGGDGLSDELDLDVLGATAAEPEPNSDFSHIDYQKPALGLVRKGFEGF